MPTSGTQRILLVEDDRKLGAFVEQGLQEEGFEVDRAFDGDEAVDKAIAADPDLVLLDFMLPKRHGVDVVAALRASGRDTPVLMLTARDSADDRARCFAAGANDLLGKPFRFQELLDRIETLLRR